MLNAFHKWFNIVVMPMSVIFVILLAYTGLWLQAFTWLCIGLAAYFNYNTEKSLAEINRIQEDWKNQE